MPVKINSLTPEQIARFPEFVKRWTDIGLCTDPADRPNRGSLQRLRPGESTRLETVRAVLAADHRSRSQTIVSGHGHAPNPLGDERQHGANE